MGEGDVPKPREVKGGLLGADYKIENGRYRFARIYNGENWNPEQRAPLTQPGVEVKPGEYLLEVEGREVRPPSEVYSFFENTAGRSEEHTSELQSPDHLVCRLLLEKKKHQALHVKQRHLGLML